MYLALTTLAYAFHIYFLRLSFNLRVHEDVVGVQLHVGDGNLGQSLVRHNTGHLGAGGEDGGVGHPRVDALNTDSGGSTATGLADASKLLLNLKLEPEVSGGSEQDVLLRLGINSDNFLPQCYKLL
jgi:hypothetical protein